MKPTRKLYEANKLNTIRDYINRGINDYPNNIAFIVKNKKDKDISYTKVSYKEFGDDLKYLGTSLINLGLEGKRIAIIGKNKYEWALSYFSILNGVGIAVPLDKGLPPEEIKSLLQRSKAEAIIFDKDYAQTIKEISAENHLLKECICMDDSLSAEFKTISTLIKNGESLVLSGDTKYENHIIVPNELATIIFTLGTTSM